MRLIIIIISSLIISVNLISSEKPQTSTLEIVVNNIDSDAGYLRVHLYNLDRAEEFPDKSHNAYKFKLVKISNGKGKVKFENIPYGKYAATLHHDSNTNAKMDKTWLGMPDEGWGLSTDVIPVFSLPSFEECSFDVNKSYVKYEILMRYLP